MVKKAYIIIAKRSKTIIETRPAFSLSTAIYDALCMFDSYTQAQVNIYTFAPGAVGNIVLTEIGSIGKDGYNNVKFFKTTK
jgi:hypothetical protein